MAPALPQDAPSVLELLSQEQELAPGELLDIELAETLKLMIDLLLADPRLPPDAWEEDGR